MSKSSKIFITYIRSKLTQHGAIGDFCKETGISRAAFGKWSSGKGATLDALDKAAEYFKQSPWELLNPQGIEATPKPKEPGNMDLLDALRELQIRIDLLEAKQPKDPLLLQIVDDWLILNKHEKRAFSSLIKKCVISKIEALPKQKKT